MRHSQREVILVISVALICSMICCAQYSQPSRPPMLENGMKVDGESSRTWTSKTGKTTLTGTVIGLDLTHIDLKTDTGKSLTIARSNLSAADEDYLTQLEQGILENMLAEFKEVPRLSKQIMISHPGIQTRSGDQYNPAWIYRIEPDAITFAAGLKDSIRLPMADLTDDLQKRFEYDPVKARQYAALKPLAAARRKLLKEEDRAQRKAESDRRSRIAVEERAEAMRKAKVASSPASAQADMKIITDRYNRLRNTRQLINDLNRFCDIHSKYASLSYEPYMTILKSMEGDVRSGALFTTTFGGLIDSMLKAEFDARQIEETIQYTVRCHIHRPAGRGPYGSYYDFLKRHREKALIAVQSEFEVIGKGTGAFKSSTGISDDAKLKYAKELLKDLQF